MISIETQIEIQNKYKFYSYLEIRLTFKLRLTYFDHYLLVIIETQMKTQYLDQI